MADYLKIPEVAQLLGLSEKTVRRRVKAGEMPSVFVGGVYRISRAGLEEYLEKAKVSPGKAPAPPSSQLTLNGELEEKRRAEWNSAVRSARQLRMHSRIDMESALALWQESKDREEDPAERRPYLDKIGELLDEAHDAEISLKSALTDRLDLVDLDEFAELQAADRFYIELFNLAQRAGLSIRTDGAQEGEAAHAGQPATHAVEEARAA